MSVNITAVIIDDEPRAIEILESGLREHPEISIAGRATSAEQAFEVVRAVDPDLIFQDIHLPNRSGFDIVAGLLQEGFKPDIIFVTAFDKYAIEAIRHAAFDFLLKPVQKEELAIAIERLHEKRLQQNRELQVSKLQEHNKRTGKIKFNTGGGFTLIRTEDILYIEADWNYADIHFSAEKKELVTLNIGAIEALLPPTDFFRISRSIIINIRFLVKVSRRHRMAHLQKDEKEYTFKIPLLNIRKLERFLED